MKARAGIFNPRDTPGAEGTDSVQERLFELDHIPTRVRPKVNGATRATARAWLARIRAERKQP